MNMIQDANVDKVGDALEAQRFHILRTSPGFRRASRPCFPPASMPRCVCARSCKTPICPFRAWSRSSRSNRWWPHGSCRWPVPCCTARTARLPAICRRHSPVGSVELVRTSALAIASCCVRNRCVRRYCQGAVGALDPNRGGDPAAGAGHTHARINPDQAFLAGLVHDLGAFYMLYRAAQYEELRVRPGTVKHVVLQWAQKGIRRCPAQCSGLPEDVVNAVTDHDQPRVCPIHCGRWGIWSMLATSWPVRTLSGSVRMRVLRPLVGR